MVCVVRLELTISWLKVKCITNFAIHTSILPVFPKCQMVIGCQIPTSTTNRGQLLDRSATNYAANYTSRTVHPLWLGRSFTSSISIGADNEIWTRPFSLEGWYATSYIISANCPSFRAVRSRKNNTPTTNPFYRCGFGSSLVELTENRPPCPKHILALTFLTQ